MSGKNPVFIRSLVKGKQTETDTYLEDAAKAIGQSKVAIDTYTEKGGENRSECFQRAPNSAPRPRK